MKNKRKISRKFIIYVAVTLIIVYIFIFTFGCVYKLDIIILLASSIPVGIIWIIYSLITLKPYIYEDDESDNENDKKGG